MAPQVRDLTMMRRAIELARQASAIGEVPVGAVVYRDDVILAEAFNRRETTADPTAHAEVLALRAAARKVGTWRLDGCGLAVTLEPCPMCAGALVNSRIAEVVYGCTDPKMGCVDTLHQLCTESRFNHRLTVRNGVLAEECAALLQDFFKQRRGSDKPSKPNIQPLSRFLHHATH